MADRGGARANTRLPWSRDRAESSRFGVIAALVLSLFMVPAVLIPALDVPEIDRAEAERIPPRFAKLVAPPPPAPAKQPEPAKEPEPKPEPKPEIARQEEQPNPAAEPQRPEIKPKVTQQPAQTREQARETASRSGLFAMKDRLRALTKPQSTNSRRLSANVNGAEVTGLSAESVAANVLGDSGGIETREGPAREVEVAGHQVADVKAPAEVAVAKAEKTLRKPAKQRAMSNIRQVFDAQKSVLYSLYKRELRKDPTLEGKVTLELTIEPNGSVSACRVVASELSNPTLEQRIAMRVQMFNFGAAQVSTRKVQFPIDFLPG
ncbi:AgmX/PglI C-terminal domain-containing protein [Marinobacter litoralis]|uniref:AgmX/PglI C-terminal domain-containing protein n=1 Tax=Marinobacter litoralis TaxID=187981 RepID=UPI0018EADA08|nr:AgmX/PglI C-terminal domain-containing protein [Marinobacter litoralis]MBJ6137730.1 AgmX/PglI C-terminal domain-containing protein [Marinobacter litoralis]